MQLSLCMLVNQDDTVLCDIYFKNTQESGGYCLLELPLIPVTVFQLLLFCNIF